LLEKDVEDFFKIVFNSSQDFIRLITDTREHSVLSRNEAGILWIRRTHMILFPRYGLMMKTWVLILKFSKVRVC